MLRVSTGLRAYLLNHGSLAEALSGGVMYIFSGTQPESPDTGTDATLLATITDAGGAYEREQPVTATVTLTAGSSGTVDSVTADGVELLESAVSYNTSLSQTASDLAAAINRSHYTNHCVYATASGAVVTLTSNRTWAPVLSATAVTVSTTTLTASKTDFGTIAETPANGLHFEQKDADLYGDPVAKLIKASGQTWSGTAGETGTATWFRFTNHYRGEATEDDGTATSTEVLRMDGSIGLADATLVLDDVTIESSDPVTISGFTITATAMQTTWSVLRMSGTLINYVLNYGSLAQALTGGDLTLCKGEQPDSAHDSMDAPLVTLADTGTYQNEEMEIFGKIVLSGTSGSVDDVTINGTSLLSAPVPFNDSISQTLADLMAALQADSFRNHGLKFHIYASTLYLNTLKTWSAVWEGGTVGVSVTTLGGTATNFGTVTNTPEAGMRFDRVDSANLVQLPSQTMAGTSTVAGDATWFRIRNHLTEANTMDVDGDTNEPLRLDGDVYTEDALLNMTSVAVSTSAATEVSGLSISATEMP